jgi:multimeric flavodoxin WrbA
MTLTPEGRDSGRKALILVGSPRKNGSTVILAREAERGLNERGIGTELVFLNDLKIRGCQACYYCKKNDVAECAVKDDMQRIHQQMRESDGIIVAAPIYFGDVTAQTKIWLDRLFPFIGMDLSPKMPGKKPVSFIFTQNQPDTKLFETPIRMFMHMTGLTGLVNREHLIAYDLDAGFKPPVTEKKEFMARAYQIGRNLLEES